MSVLSNKPGSGCNSSFSGQNSSIRATSGWDDVVYDTNIISIVNSKISLLSILKKYNVQLNEVYSASGWTHKGQCPLPDHSDKTPSFGYNSVEDRFNCFGCHRGGRAVEFFAALTQRSAQDAAKYLIQQSPDKETILQYKKFDHIRLEKIIFGYSEFILKFKRQYNFSDSAVLYAENVTWTLDVYLRKNVVTNNIDFNTVESIINKLKAQIEAYIE